MGHLVQKAQEATAKNCNPRKKNIHKSLLIANKYQCWR
jgi:hypothetical protein